MNNQILTDGTVLYYALKVNGAIITPPVLERHQLEQFRQNMPEDQRRIAEVVAVTPEGRELLLG